MDVKTRSQCHEFIELLIHVNTINTIVLMLMMGGNVINAVEQLLFKISQPEVNRISGQLDLLSLNLNGWFLAAKAQLNTCTCLSVCSSVCPFQT